MTRNVGTGTTPPDPREVTCACGNITAIQVSPMKIENLRCWLCPKEDAPPRPVLRLVKG